MAEIDREKVIKGLKLCVATGDFCGECPYDGMESCIDKLHDDVLAMLKEQEAREQCLKTKCVICPHCANCDVDENGRLKKQEPMKPNRSGTHTFCAKCGAAFKNSADFCPHCGQELKWE